MRILRYALAGAVFSGIGQDAVAGVFSAHSEQQPYPEVLIMAVSGLALLGVSAILRWRMRT